MFYSIRGTYVHAEENFAVIECGGVGYKCYTTLSTLSALPKVGSQVMLYTHVYVKEDIFDIFGFLTRQELSYFRMLLGVSGIGPKAALAVLSEMTPEKFALCVIANDVKSLTKVSGIGPKSAGRIVLELKDKMKSVELPDSFDLPAAPQMESGNVAEAISALVVLGYSQSEAAQALGKQDETRSVQELIKHALKQLAGKA
ncbi:Holliday junction branch migration protein RuvA [Candidatus Soleaferrea massiliensis]|uniref:Holliday junction branch migration protein RuvA n=1 Tax=Candidatus Soleaferrea massiliensis TaxID=1470354 RepID=UPI00058CABA0|nr:Holliday junction branch migration protein RuvA [Candidatus Soleaferrea massiliensis]